MDPLPFQPRPASEHLARWPQIILPTFELLAMMQGAQCPPGLQPNSPHVCDFEDGTRLIVSVNQEAPGAAEQLEVCLSAAPSCPMQGIEMAVDHWLRIIVERLIDIDPSERPRTVRRHIQTKQGVLIALFEWNRYREEQAAIRELKAKGLDPYPLGRYVEMFTVYRAPRDHPNLAFVVRRQVIIDGAILPAGAWSAPTLEEVRDYIPAYQVNIGRSPQDDAVIAEVWV